MVHHTLVLLCPLQMKNRLFVPRRPHSFYRLYIAQHRVETGWHNYVMRKASVPLRYKYALLGRLPETLVG